MKKNIIFSFAIVLTMLTITKCKKPDNVVYDVLDSASANQGAVLRTIERVKVAFSYSDVNSTFEVILEEQDPEYGDLLEKVNVYVTYFDRFDDGVDNSVAEKFFESIPKSSFTQSDNNLPMVDYSVSFQDILTLLNLQTGDYNPGDQFKFRFEIVLTDGRTYSEDNTSSTLQQSFFRSPYSYYVSIVCPPVSGDYTLILHDSYGDGWQGSKIIVTIDDNETEYSLPNLWETPGMDEDNVGDPQFVEQTFTISVPATFQTLTWEWVSGDFPSEATFKIKGPNTGNVIYEGGPSEPDGEFMPNYCNE